MPLTHGTGDGDDDGDGDKDDDDCPLFSSSNIPHLPLTHGRDGDDVVLLNGDDDDDDGDKDDDDYPCSSNIPHLLLNHDNGDGDGCDGCVNETMKVIGTNELTNN